MRSVYRKALGRSLEEGQRELLVDDADVEVDEAGAGDVDADLVDGEPEEELLGGDAGEGGDLAVADGTGYGGVVADLRLELRSAGAVELDLELAGFVDGEVLDALGQETDGEAVGSEHVVRAHRRFLD